MQALTLHISLVGVVTLIHAPYVFNAERSRSR
jgi:hypothetical protein